MFQKHKDQALLELKQEINDKSKKGNVDVEILDILNYINENFTQLYTTSSCAGRIILDSITKDRKKNQCIWLYVNHKGQAKFQDLQDKIQEALKSEKENKKEQEQDQGREIWLLVEPPIFHICCKDVKSASTLINSSHLHGFKSSGIFSIKQDKVMVEIKGSEKLEVPIMRNEKLLIDDKYLQSLVDISNDKMKKRNEVLKKFQEGLEKLKESGQLNEQNKGDNEEEEEISNQKKQKNKKNSKKFNKEKLNKSKSSEKFSWFQTFLTIGFLLLIFLVAAQYIQLWRD